MKKRSHASFYKNTAWQYGLQVVKYLFPLIVMPYLTRVLQPEGYAIYAYVVSFMTFAQTFVDFGFNLSGTKEIANAKNSEEENRVVGGVTEARVVLGAIAAVGVFVIALFIPITRENLLYTMLAYVAVFGKALAPDFVFQGHEDMGPITTRYLVSKGASTVLTFVLVHSISDLLWIPVLDILSSVIALVWSFAAARKRFDTTISLVPLRRTLTELKVSGLYCFSNMASVVFSGFTTLLIGVVVTDRSMVSYWSLAMTSVSAIQSLYTPITNSLYPHMVRGKDFDFAKKIALIGLPVVTLGTVAFGLLSNVVMLVLGGNSYLEGSWVITAVSPVLFFSFFDMLFGWPVLGAAGRVAEVTKTTVISALFCIAALLIVSALGFASMQVICLIRCITEAILCLTRLYYAVHYVFTNSD